MPRQIPFAEWCASKRWEALALGPCPSADQAEIKALLATITGQQHRKDPRHG